MLGCYVRKSGVQADPEKVSSICSWPTPKNPTDCVNGSDWLIICISIQRIMPVLYSLYRHFEEIRHVVVASRASSGL